MRRALQFSANQLQHELFSCIRQLLSAGDDFAVMRSFLYQSTVLQGAVGGLIGINSSLATQPGAGRSDFKMQSVGPIMSKLFTHNFDELSDGAVNTWEELVSVATQLGWSPSEPRFSKSFGTLDDPNFYQIYGYAVRSNFGDVLGFVIYMTPDPDPFTLMDANTTLIAQLSLFRLLEMNGVRQCAFRKTGSELEFYETTGSMFPAIDDVYSRAIHSLNGVMATIAMQSQLIVHESSEAEKVNARTLKILDLIQQAEIHLNRSESMTRLFNGRVESVDFGDLVDLSSVTGALQPISEFAIVSDTTSVILPESPMEKLVLYFLCHNVVRLLSIRAQTSSGRSQTVDPKFTLQFALEAEKQQIKITGSLPADPEVDLNTDIALKEHEFQLGRRLNTPRRILQQVLVKLGGSMTWETQGQVTYLIMRVPLQYAHGTT